jgi:hypothetical protein
MASTRQCLLNQFADLSVCANQNNFHKNSILVSDLRIHLFTFNLGGESPRELADADLLASALPSIFAVNVRFTKAGTNASMKRFP